jgi:hypothetical protein
MDEWTVVVERERRKPLKFIVFLNDLSMKVKRKKNSVKRMCHNAVAMGL